ncbi:hypothetical protein [Shimia marina]|uniref:Tellurite resistance protein TerB n=1 Tax=Shimia marina TaxID=321267 RepID=A0A0P1EUC7_9RHOB|nr:hypothetical protein [Shimia marina]CUH54207.1 hypothetical protein SHM7688_03677 [Shimia marina]SFD97678.1 hypothetical protein SAMN04488037_10487 [Shimia marina]
MHILIALLTAIGGAIWWWVRMNPREAIDTAADIGTTVINAPRRLAFRRKTGQHPVEGIDDPRIAICAIAQAFVEADGLPTQEQRDKLHFLLRQKLRCTEEETKEMEVLGRWLMTQCDGPAAAVPRLARRLNKIDNGAAWDQLQDVLYPLVQGELSEGQISAIDDLRVAFKR